MKSGLFTLLVLISSQLNAQPLYLCKNEKFERVIEVVHEDINSLVPCEVKYTKGSKTETLWVAQNEQGFCEEKARTLADKLTSLGIPCVLQENIPNEWFLD